MEYHPSSFLKLSLPILIASYSLLVPETVSKPSINPVSSYHSQSVSQYKNLELQGAFQTAQMLRNEAKGGPIIRRRIRLKRYNTKPMLSIAGKEEGKSESAKKLDSPMLSELEGDNSRSKMKLIHRRIGMNDMRMRRRRGHRNRSGNNSHAEPFRASPLLNVVRVGNMNGGSIPMSESTWTAGTFHNTGQTQYNGEETRFIQSSPRPNFGSEEMKFDISNGTLPSSMFISQNNGNGYREYYHPRTREFNSHGEINSFFHREFPEHELDNSALSTSSSDMSRYSAQNGHRQKEGGVLLSPYSYPSSVVSLRDLKEMVRVPGHRRLKKKDEVGSAVKVLMKEKNSTLSLGGIEKNSLKRSNDRRNDYSGGGSVRESNQYYDEHDEHDDDDNHNKSHVKGNRSSSSSTEGKSRYGLKSELSPPVGMFQGFNGVHKGGFGGYFTTTTPMGVLVEGGRARHNQQQEHQIRVAEEEDGDQVGLMIK